MTLESLHCWFWEYDRLYRIGESAISDLIALESLLAQAIQCETLEEFADVL